MAIEQCDGYREGFERPKRNPNELMVCDTCGWESDDGWAQNDHFLETKHAHFTPKSLMLQQNREIRERGQKAKDELFARYN